MLRQEKNKNISACAGVALVHGHYPFSNAYDIAEECCFRAKKKRIDEIKNKREDKGDMVGYLDYYLVRGSKEYRRSQKTERFSGLVPVLQWEVRMGSGHEIAGGFALDFVGV